MSTKIVLQNCVISFPTLFTPRAPKGSETPRYSASFILPENFDWTEVKAAAELAKKEKWPSGAPAELQSQIKKVTEGPYNGRYCINANASIDHKPTTVDQNLAPVMDTSVIFAGCIVNAQISFFGYDKGKPGVGVGLNMVQLVKSDGVTRLDNTQSVDDVFSKVAGAPPAQQASSPVEQSAPATTDASAPPADAATQADPWE
jgi:hypothetical protein